MNVRYWVKFIFCLRGHRISGNSFLLFLHVFFAITMVKLGKWRNHAQGFEISYSINSKKAIDIGTQFIVGNCAFVRFALSIKCK